MPTTPEAPRYVLAAPGSVTPPRKWTKLLAASSLLAAAFRAAPLPLSPALAGAPATNYIVLNNHDNGGGSLRQAIIDANLHPGPDQVTFQAGLSGIIPLLSQITISDSVQIIGPGPGALAVSGGHTTRVFYLNSSALFTTTISGLTIRDGSANTGGGLHARGETLILDNVHLISNTVTGYGGALELSSNGGGQSALTLRNSLVSGNQAVAGGGVALYGPLHAVNIENTQFISNVSTGRGGGLFLYAVSAPTTISSSTFLSNSAASGGGVALYRSAGPVTMSASRLEGNQASGGGGGLFLYHSAALTVTTSTISGNQAGGNGGGLFFYGPRAVTIKDSTISGNKADGNGAGLFLYSPQSPFSLDHVTLDNNQSNAYGGALALNLGGSGATSIRRSTISNNGAVGGAGLWLGRLYYPLLLENTTVSGNGALHGGGLYVHTGYADRVSIQSSTIVSNSAAANGGGLLIAPGVFNSMALTNTIVANNSAINDPDLAGAFRLKNDLVEVTGSAVITNAGGNVFGLDPLLGELADNGGPTRTHLPAANSPVLNAGDPAFAPPPSTDQRDLPRVVKGRIDIGAVERGLERLLLPLLER